MRPGSGPRESSDKVGELSQGITTYCLPRGGSVEQSLNHATGHSERMAHAGLSSLQLDAETHAQLEMSTKQRIRTRVEIARLEHEA